MPQPPIAPGPVPGSQYSALDIIKGSLRAIGALPGGENPTADEANDALPILNQMLDAWNAERLMVFTITRALFVPVTLKQSYSLGLVAGADIQIARPTRISYVSVISLSNAAQPLELPLEMLTDSQWRDIPVKNISSSLPQKCYDDGGFPTRILNLWPIPSVQVNFAIYAWTPLSQFQALNTVLSFPPGYAEALRYNLAPRLAPEYGKSTPAEVVALALESKSRIKSVNYVPSVLSVDAALVSGGGEFNWLTGEPVGR